MLLPKLGQLLRRQEADARLGKMLAQPLQRGSSHDRIAEPIYAPDQNALGREVRGSYVSHGAWAGGCGLKSALRPLANCGWVAIGHREWVPLFWFGRLAGGHRERARRCAPPEF